MRHGSRPARERLHAGARLRLAAEILADYAIVRWHLRRRHPFPEALAAVRATPKRRRTDGLTGIRLGHAVVRTLSILPTDSRCLMRSLVLLRLLERRGIAASLVLGVAGPSGFAAHAWVEHEGAPLLATGGKLFERLVEL